MTDCAFCNGDRTALHADDCPVRLRRAASPALAIPRDVRIVALYRMPHASPTASFRHPWCDADCPWHGTRPCRGTAP